MRVSHLVWLIMQAHQANARTEMERMGRAALIIQRAWRRHRTSHQFGGSPRRCSTLLLIHATVTVSLPGKALMHLWACQRM